MAKTTRVLNIENSPQDAAPLMLAHGIAHDLNNLLTVIMGYSDLLLTRCDLPEPARLKVEEIKKAGMRASSLTRQLVALSRKQA